MNVVRQQCVERACEILEKSINLPGTLDYSPKYIQLCTLMQKKKE